MKSKLFLSFCMYLCFACTSDISAQIFVDEEPGIGNLMSRYIALNQQNTMVKAWRVQILATNDRREMENASSKFQNLYPSREYDWKHAAPYYQIYIGAFEKKEDFEAFIIELKKDFPSSIPVIERIEKSKLL